MRVNNQQENIPHAKIRQKCGIQFFRLKSRFQENKLRTCLIKNSFDVIRAFNKLSNLILSETEIDPMKKLYSTVCNYFRT